MRKYFISITAVSLVMILTGAFYLISQNNPQETKTKKSSSKQEMKETKCCCSDMMKSSEMSDNSVYLLDENWKNENNASVKWSSLEGTPRIMAMIFTNCAYACPVIVNDMKKVESGLTKADLQKVKFLLVSIDPERDTPENLMKFAKLHDLDLNRWQLLTSNESNVSELAAVMGFQYKKENDGSYSHSNIISVLNKEGEIAYQHFGLNKDIGDIIEAVKKLN